MILVVGATGQLGTAVVRKLREEGRPVRAFVRPGSDYDHLAGMDVELAFGDLRDAESVDAACRGVEAVVATANVVAPRTRGDSFEALEVDGYGNLFAACERHGVGQVVYVSVPVSRVDAKVPQIQYKRFNERRLMESDLNYTIVRAPLFMDVWFALLGSSLPLRDAENPSLARPFWFSRLYRRLTGSLVESRGVALVPGAPDDRHSFVVLDDVATFLVRCLGHRVAERAVLHFGGPEALSWAEVLETFADVLGRDVRGVYVSPRVFAVEQRLLAPVSTAASNVLGLSRYAASHEAVYDPAETAEIMVEPRTSAEQFLREKASIPDATSEERRGRRWVPTGA